MPYRQNCRHFSQFQRGSKIFQSNISSQHARIKTPFRLQSNHAEDRIRNELAQEFRQSMKVTHLVRPLIFTVGVSSASIVGCTIWEYEFVRSQVNKMMNSSINFFQNRQKNVGQFFKFRFKTCLIKKN